MKKDNIKQLVFRLKIRKTIQQQAIELIHITKEECNRELERRNKK